MYAKKRQQVQIGTQKMPTTPEWYAENANKSKLVLGKRQKIKTYIVKSVKKGQRKNVVELSYIYCGTLQSKVDPMVATNWLRAFVRNNNKNRSPLRHLLYLQFLEVDLDELFSANEVVGKRAVIKKHIPLFDINDRRAKWLRLMEENQEASREELKEKGKGLHTWVFRHDRAWYEKVTPRVRVRKLKTDPIDWKKRDSECLEHAKGAVQSIIDKEGKPTRVTPSSVRMTVGARNWFNNKKLIRTQQYLQEAKEDINDFRIRKISWAIGEMGKQDGYITAYKVQLYAGFGGGGNEVRELIEKVLEEY